MKHLVLADQELEAWNLVKNSSAPEDLRDFLQEFPTGTNASNDQARSANQVTLYKFCLIRTKS